MFLRRRTKQTPECALKYGLVLNADITYMVIVMRMRTTRMSSEHKAAQEGVSVIRRKGARANLKFKTVTFLLEHVL